MKSFVDYLQEQDKHKKILSNIRQLYIDNNPDTDENIIDRGINQYKDIILKWMDEHPEDAEVFLKGDFQERQDIFDDYSEEKFEKIVQDYIKFKEKDEGIGHGEKPPLSKQELKYRVNTSQLETQIVDTWNNHIISDNKETYPIIDNSPIPEKDEKGEWKTISKKDKQKEIINVLNNFCDKKNIKPNILFLRHKGNENINTSVFWRECYPQQGNETGKSKPKSDITYSKPINDKLINFSVKEIGSSRLMSGGVGETTATIFCALDTMREKNYDKYVSLIKRIFDNMKSIATERGANDIKKSFAEDRNSLTKKELEVILTQIVNNTLNQEIKDFFENDPEFKWFFCYEASTGWKKFVDADNKPNKVKNYSAVATNFFLIDRYTYKSEIYPIEEYISEKKIFQYVKINLGFKTEFKKGNRLLVNSLHAMIKNKEKTSGRTGKFIEHYRDFISTLVNKEQNDNLIPGIVSENSIDENAIDYIKKVIKKIIDFFIEFFNALKDFVLSSTENFINVFNLKETLVADLVSNYTF